MVKSDAWREGCLDLFFRNIDFTGLGDAGGLRGSVGVGSIYIAAHTADPGLSTSQEQDEVLVASWPSYARQAVTRNETNWLRLGNYVGNVPTVSFGAYDGTGSLTIVALSAGTAASGEGKLCYPMFLSSPIVLTPGVTLQFVTNELIFGEL